VNNDELEEMRRSLLEGDAAASSAGGKAKAKHSAGPAAHAAGAEAGPAAAPAAGAAAAAPRRRRGHRVRSAISAMGEVFITVGVLMLLMVAYQLWWTNVEGAQAIAAQRDEIVQLWDTDPTSLPTDAGPEEIPAEKAPAYGKPIGLLYIPRMESKVNGLPLRQGTGQDVLATGAGHYRGTAMPGEIGNFSIAAHRSGHGEPFGDFAELRTGDKVFVRTKNAWYTYELTTDEPNLTPYDTWVIQPVPGQPGVEPTEKLITLTTCTPRYGSTGRWAWFGVLVDVTPASAGAPAGVDAMPGEPAA
jgi:sortase A